MRDPGQPACLGGNALSCGDGACTLATGRKNHYQESPWGAGLAGIINIHAYSDALVVLGTAGVVVPLFRRWGVSPILGYLGAGAVLGPLGLGSFIRDVPVLYWLTVVDARNVASIAELGIVFLFFLIGMELSLARLKAMRRMVFGLGMLQVVVTACLIAAIARASGQSATTAIVVGASLALSSTAIVIEILSKQGRVKTHAGRATFSVLLAQDIAVVPILFFVAVLAAGAGAGAGGATGSGTHLIASLGIALTQTAVALIGIVVLGRLFLRPLFRLVAQAQSTELFVAAILFVIVGTGVAAATAGLSMALGAFVAGLLLSETEYRKAIEAIVEPFKGLLLGIFFFTVGMSIDFREIQREPVVLLGCVAGLIVLKATVLLALGRLFQLSWPITIETALLLGPGGEFAFVGIGAALAAGVVPEKTASFVLAVTSITMVLIPLLALLARRIDRWFSARKPAEPELAVPPVAVRGQVIVVGHGRVGQVVCALLREHKVPFIVTDSDAGAVARERRRGSNVYYGDATNPAFLQACGLRDASGVIITIHTQAAIDEVVRLVRLERPEVPIVARARDAAHASHLYAIGVSDAVPETIEASLQLSEAALVGIGVPMGLVIASIHAKRDEFRHELQQLAHSAGQGQTLAVKAKTTP